jgi:hypothetical protein
MFPSNHSWVTQDNKIFESFLFEGKKFFNWPLFKNKKYGKSLNSCVFCCYLITRKKMKKIFFWADNYSLPIEKAIK